MSASSTHASAERDQLYDAYTPQERNRLHEPVTDADFQAWGLPVPYQGTPLPWRTRGEFMVAAMFRYEETEAWCRVVTSGWIGELCATFGTLHVEN